MLRKLIAVLILVQVAWAQYDLECPAFVSSLAPSTAEPEVFGIVSQSNANLIAQDGSHVYPQ